MAWRAHAIPRNRALCGLALGYEPKPPLDYGLDRAAIAGAAETARPYAVLIHATAQPGKEWADEHWVAVARALRDRGFDVVLPWGADAERARSEADRGRGGVRRGAGASAARCSWRR